MGLPKKLRFIIPCKISWPQDKSWFIIGYPDYAKGCWFFCSEGGARVVEFIKEKSLGFDMVDLIVPLNETNISSLIIIILPLLVVLTETNILVENVDTPYNNIEIIASVINEVS